jgi:hypothetical protein
MQIMTRCTADPRDGIDPTYYYCTQASQEEKILSV